MASGYTLSKHGMYKTARIAKDTAFFKKDTIVSVSFRGITQGIPTYDVELNGVKQDFLFATIHLVDFTL